MPSDRGPGTVSEADLRTGSALGTDTSRRLSIMIGANSDEASGEILLHAST